MSRKLHLEYSQLLEDNWRVYIDELIQQELDCFVVAGDLFSTPKPWYRTLQTVMGGLQLLAEKGVSIFIFPGPHDSPLYHDEDDYPHNIFRSIPNVKILSKIEDKTNLEINEPSFFGEIKGVPIEIYTPPTALRELSSLEFKFTGRDDRLTFFIVNARFINIVRNSDSSSGSDNTRPQVIDKSIKIDAGFIERLRDHGIDVLLLGGPNSFNVSDYDFGVKIITCPPLNPIDFFNAGEKVGIRVISLSMVSSHSFTIQDEILVSKPCYKMHQASYDVTNCDASKVNIDIKKILEENSGKKDMVFQLRLKGKMEKNFYHQLSLYDFMKKGRDNNIYFELLDEIQFGEAAEEISGLNPLEELERLALNDVGQDPRINDINREVIEKIKNDWEQI
ncbi:MAG: hypothetical protein ACTSYF_17755 [Promethearchaeota archaeon]